MKKKEGFTLIELLAVIIILAIIALIATPIIMRVINKAKEGADKRSAENYVSAAETAIYGLKMSNSSFTMDGECSINGNGNLNCDGVTNEVAVAVKGAKPTGGILVFKDGKLATVVNLKINDKEYSYDNNKMFAKNSDTPICTVAENGQKYVGQKLDESDYVNYTGYTSGPYYNGTITSIGLPSGTNLTGVYQALGKTMITPTFDSTTKKWNVGGTTEAESYGGYLEIQEAGRYRIAVENGWIAYVFKATDEGSPTYFQQYNLAQNNGYDWDQELQTTNNKSDYVSLDAGDKILIFYSSAGSSFYLEKEDTTAPRLIGTKYTCQVNDDESYDFYALSINDNGTVNLLMNDNVLYSDYTGYDQENRRTYGLIPWYETDDHRSYGAYGPLTALSYLDGATSNWTNIPNLDEVYHDENITYQTLAPGNHANGYYNNPITFTGHARLPKMSELLDLGCTDKSQSCPKWLSDNIVASVYDENDELVQGIYDYGYWTLSSVSYNNPQVVYWHAWRVTNDGGVQRNNTNSIIYGVRPVITLSAVF